MRHAPRWIGFGLLALAAALAAAVPRSARAAVDNETEPNNTHLTANSLTLYNSMTGSIGSPTDVDYYSFSGINANWGVIALLDTSGASGSTTATLEMLGSDGATVMQSDSGSWTYGSGIAVQPFAGIGETYYFRVTETGQDATLSAYSLRFFITITNTQPESEPNETRAAGTASAYTMAGVIGASDDADCFRFEAEAGDTVLLALNADPEGDGNALNPALELYSPADVLLQSVDVTKEGHKEFLEYENLPAGGVHAYCVRRATGTAGLSATYHAGVMLDGNPIPSHLTLSPVWLEAAYAPVARGFVLSFRLDARNDGLVEIPGSVELSADYDPACLQFAGANPLVTGGGATYAGHLSWQGQKTGLAAGETYTATAYFTALRGCREQLTQSVSLPYLGMGTSQNADYWIKFNSFLPGIAKQP